MGDNFLIASQDHHAIRVELRLGGQEKAAKMSDEGPVTLLVNSADGCGPGIAHY